MSKQEKNPEQFPHDVDTAPISVGRVWLDHYAKGKDGATCPLCGTERRYTAFKLNSQLARLLIMLYRCYGVGYIVNVAKLIEISKRPNIVKGREWNKLRYWGLVELVDLAYMPTTKPTDLCRMTQAGQDFVYRNLRVPKTTWVHNHQLMAVDSETILIQAVLGRNHNYNMLMNEDYSWNANDGVQSS